MFDKLLMELTGTTSDVLRVRKLILEGISLVKVEPKSNGKGFRSCSRNPFGETEISKERAELCSLVGVRDFTKKEIYDLSPELNEFRYGSDGLKPEWKTRLKRGLLILFYNMGWLDILSQNSISENELKAYLDWLVDPLQEESWGSDKYMQPYGSISSSSEDSLNSEFYSEEDNATTANTPPSNDGLAALEALL